MTNKKGFIGSVFDFSFSSFVAPRIVGIIYALSIVGVALAVLGIISGTLLTAFSYNSFFFALVRSVITIVVSVLVAIVYLMFIRVGLESLVAGVITAQNSGEIKDMVRQIRNENA